MKKTLIGLGTAALLLTSACGGETTRGTPADETRATDAQSLEAAPVEIEISGFAFSPKDVQVAVGQAIVWTNADDIAHTVTSGKPKKQGVPGVSEDRDAQPDGTFDSGTMELDDTYEFTADEAGSFTYFCAIHAGMSARIVVR